MKIITYRILEKKSALLKTLLVLAVLLFCSFGALFLPQIGSPHALKRYFGSHNNAYTDTRVPWTISSKRSLATNYDIEWSFDTRSVELVGNIDDIVEQASQKIYGISEIEANIVMQARDFYIDNVSTNKLAIFGVNNAFYRQLESISIIGASESAGAIYLCNESLTQVTFNLTASFQRDFSLVLNSTKIANVSHFYGNYSEFFCEIAGGYFDDYDNKGLFLPIAEYYELLYEPFNEASGYMLFMKGHLMFSEHQQEIMYWSVDSISKCKSFEKEFIEIAKKIYPAHEASNNGPSSDFYKILANSEDNYALVALIFSLIQPVQIIIWLITFSLIIFIIADEYRRNSQKELRQILSGKDWKERLSLVALDTLFSTVPSIALSFGILAAFVLTQRFLLGVPFALATDIVSGLGIISACFVILVFVLRLDFEVYLRGLFTNRVSSSSDYKPLSWLGNGYKVAAIIAIAIAVIFLYSRTALVFGFQLISIFLSLLVGLLGSLMLLGVYSLVRRYFVVRARKTNSSLSAFQLLLAMWKRKLSGRIILNAILFSLFCSTMIYTSTSVDAIKGTYQQEHGAWVSCYTRNGPTNEPIVASVVSNSSLIEEHTFDYSVVLSYNTTASIFNQNLTFDTYNNHFRAIDFDDYLSFYKDWNKKNWLSAGNLTNISNRSCFVSKAFADSNDLSVDSELLLKNDTEPLIVRGILDNWQNIFSRDDDDYAILLDSQVFLGQMAKINNTQEIHLTCYFAVAEKNILASADYLVEAFATSLKSSHWYISNFDSKAIVGTRMVHQNIIYFSAQLLLFILLVEIVRKNIVSLHNHPDSLMLGFFAMSVDHKKLLLKYRVLEVVISSIIFLQIALGLYLLGSPFYQLSFVSGRFILSAPSVQTILNLVLVLILFPAVLTIEAAVNYHYQRQLKLSLLYRHSE